MLADTLGIKLHTINTSEGGALGAIILAMVGCRQYKNVQIACKKIIKDVETYHPNMTNNKIYRNKFAKFKSYYLTLRAV
jgi:xylulokinase